MMVVGVVKLQFKRWYFIKCHHMRRCFLRLPLIFESKVHFSIHSLPTWIVLRLILMNVRIEISNNALMQFQILDFPGGFRFDDKDRDRSGGKLEPSKVFQRPGSLVFVIDGQITSVWHESTPYVLFWFFCPMMTNTICPIAI